MTSPDPAPLRELVRVLAVLVARPRVHEQAIDMLSDILHDHVLLNQGLSFRTLCFHIRLETTPHEKILGDSRF